MIPKDYPGELEYHDKETFFKPQTWLRFNNGMLEQWFEAGMTGIGKWKPVPSVDRRGKPFDYNLERG